MTRALRRMLLLAIFVLAAPGAGAGPESCLSLDNNFAVAACANQYLPGDPSVPFRHNPVQPPKPVRPAPGYNGMLSYNVPVAQVRPVDRSGERSPLQVDVERAALLNQAAVAMSIAGALGVLFVVWRWRASKVRTCKFCAAKLSPGSNVCRKCFRAI